MRHTILFITVLLSVLLIGCKEGELNIGSLKIEMQENPEGLGTPDPRFSWQITSTSPDLIQQSYQIQVARSENDLKKGENLLWDSGIVSSDESVLIPYRGQPLSSRGKYYWRVKVDTNQGSGNWSKINHWSMALLDDSEWQAKWIGEDSLSNPNETDKDYTRLAARYLRKPFDAKNSKVNRAVLYIAGLGTHEAYLNGKRVSEDLFSPTVSWFPNRVYYNTYDVTPLLRKNENLLDRKSVV